MKKLISLIVAFCFLHSSSSFILLAQDRPLENINRPLITVVDIELKGAFARTLIADLAAKSREVLVSTNNYVVLDRGNQLGMLLDMGIKPGEECDAKCATKIGQMLRAEYVIFGSVTEISRMRCTISLQMMDIIQETIVDEAHSASGCMPDEILDSMEVAVYRVAHLEMRPAKLVVNATPGNTEIYLDEDYKGHVPVYLNITPGFHKVKATADGYYPETRTINFKLAERITLDFRLREVEKKWYKTWWFWGAVGLVVVGGTVVAFSGGGDGGGDDAAGGGGGSATFYVPTYP